LGAADHGKSIRLLAVDIDGTLVTEGDVVSPATRAALHLAAERFALVLATGRRYRTTRQVLATLDLALPAVCLGGALTKSAAGQTLHAAPFAAEDVSRLLGLAHRRRLALVLQRDAHALGGADFVVDASLPWNAATKHYVNVGGTAGETAPDIGAGRHGDVLVVGCFGERDPLAALEDDVAGLGQDYETVLVPSQKTPGWYLEVIAAGVSKWAALRRYASGLGIPEEAICAVGDALNDLPMIRGAGFGVAMGNADPAVKAAASWTTGRHDEDGLVTLIDRLMAD
jgi:hypothetical protein